MKKARMNISHSRFILSKLKIFGEIVTTKFCIQIIRSNKKIISHLDKISTAYWRDQYHIESPRILVRPGCCFWPDANDPRSLLGKNN